MTKAIALGVCFIFLVFPNLHGQDIQKKFSQIDSLLENGSFEEALTLSENCLEATKDMNAGKDSLYAISLNAAGISNVMLGNFETAEEQLNLSESIFTGLGLKESREYSKLLSNLFYLYYSTGRINECEELVFEILRLKEINYGKDDIDYAMAINNIAIYYNELGFYSEAEKYYKSAIDVVKTVLGEEHPFYATSLDNLASLYYDTGQYFEAEELGREAMNLRKRLLGDEHPDYLQSLNTLGVMNLEFGRLGEAEKIFEELIYKTETDLAEGNPDYVIRLNNYAQLLSAANKTDKADSIFQKILNVIRISNPENSLLLINPLNAYGVLKAKKNEYANAVKLFKEANQIISENKREKSANHYYNLLQWGKTELSAKKYEEAYKLFTQAREVAITNFSENSIDYFHLLFLFGKYYEEVKDIVSARESFTKAFELYYELLKKTIPYFTEKNLIDFYRNTYKNFEIYASFTINHFQTNPDLTKELFNFSNSLTSVVYNSSAKLTTSPESTTVRGDRDVYKEWRSIKNQLSRVITLSKNELTKNGINIDSLIELSETLERKIRKEGGYEDNSEPALSDFSAVQRRLDNDEAYLKILRINYLDPLKQRSTVYAGIIITSETSEYPQMVILPEGEKLEAGIFEKYLEEIKGTENPDPEIYYSYWGQLAKYLKGKQRVIIQPDGVFNKINLNTLINPETGVYLLDEVELIYNTAYSNNDEKKNAPINNTAVLVGSPKFSLIPDLQNPDEVVENISKARIFLEELPGTKEEVEIISEELEKAGWEVQKFTDELATEESIKNVHNPRVLHIATHGAFLPEEQTGEDFNASGIERFFLSENPLNRAILFLAGANRTLGKGHSYKDNFEDGLLTSNEMINLRLDETELVVLSSCESGLGEIRNGEGMYGMQRALQTAGAKYIIMSLWEVDDISTRELMTDFYNMWIKSGDIRTSFKEAQIRMRDRYNYPVFWGGFILTGN